LQAKLADFLFSPGQVRLYFNDRRDYLPKPGEMLQPDVNQEIIFTFFISRIISYLTDRS
jgi:hypothetical protein